MLECVIFCRRRRGGGGGSMSYLAAIADKLDGEIDVAYTASQVESGGLKKEDVMTTDDGAINYGNTLLDEVGWDGGGKPDPPVDAGQPFPAFLPVNQRLSIRTRKKQIDDYRYELAAEYREI